MSSPGAAPGPRDGEDDHLFSAGQREQIASRLKQAGARFELVVYPGNPHGFCCDERDTYRPQATADAWRRTLQLLAAELYQGTRQAAP